MRRFWLCIFFVACIPVFAEDAVTRATSYGSENIKSDAETSATEYAGMPKKFKNGKVVTGQSDKIFTAEKSEEKKKPEIVLSERTDDESLRTESAMRFLPESFENTVSTEQPKEKIPASAVPYYQPYLSELSLLPMSEEVKPTEVVLPEEDADAKDSETGSKMHDLPKTYEKMQPEVVLEESSRSEPKMLPESSEKENAAVTLPEEDANAEDSETGSKMHDLPKTYEKMQPEVVLEESSRSEPKMLPESSEKENAAVTLPEEDADAKDSETGSKMQDLPKTYEKMQPEAVLEESSRSEPEMLPELSKKENATVALPEEDADAEDSETGSKMLELPLPNALFEDNKENSEDLPFIWEEDTDEEPEQEEFYDEDLPTLIDVPEVTLEESEKPEVFDVPAAKSFDVEDFSAFPQEFAESDKVLDETYESSEPGFDVQSEKEASAENEPNENYESELPKTETAVSLPEEKTLLKDFNANEREWVFKKDSRKLMDFQDNFDGFPKSIDDVFDNPAQYQYDDENLVVESGRKIDNLTGQQLFDSAVNYIKSNEAAKAVKLLKELLHYNFSVPETEHLLALAEFKNGNTEEATKYLNRSLMKYKNPYLRAENMELQGEIYFSQEKYNEAYENFMAAIVGVNAMRDAELYNKAGIAALRAGDIEKARKAWKTGKYLGSKSAKRNLIWLDH